MNHDEVFARRGRNEDVRDAFGRWWQGGEEREWQVPHCLAKFGPVGSVPGVDRIEGFERRYACAFLDPHQVETRIRDRSRSVGESDQRQNRPRRPDFGVLDAGSFERGQR
jgi:hypothetical protein